MASQRLTSRFLVGALGAALIGVVPPGSTAPATAAAPTIVTHIDAEFSRATVPYRDQFTLAGVVEYEDGDTRQPLPPGNGPVFLQRRLEGSDVWKTLQTDASGESFSFVATAVANADYRVVYDGNETYLPTRATGPLKVTRLMHDRIVDGTLVLRGRVEPGWANRNVVVQVRRGGEWRRYDLVRTDDDSRWSKRLFAREGRNTRFRAFVPATTRFAKSFTDTYITSVAAG